MEVIPAIDLRDGRCVRLVQGDYERETVFSDDPVAMARRWADEGAPRLHIVDLDGARSGRPENSDVVKLVLRGVDLPVQVAGGIRDLDAVDVWLAAGADRVVLGTAAVRNPGLAAEACRQHGAERVVVSLDAREGYFAAEGWQESTEERAEDLLRRFVELGVERFVYTDIARDGTLTSPNFEAVDAFVQAAGDAAVIASGGVAAVEHLTRLAELGVEGAIVGRALYDGALTLSDALAAVGGAQA